MNQTDYINEIKQQRVLDQQERISKLEQQLAAAQKDATDWEDACAHWEEEAITAKAKIAELRSRAQEVIDRWETPLWKDAPSTAEFIYKMRDAL